MVFLGIITLLEFFGGIALLFTAKAVFQEMEGLMLIGFGILTMATMYVGRLMVEAIDRLDSRTEDANSKPSSAISAPEPATAVPLAPDVEPIGKWSRRNAGITGL